MFFGRDETIDQLNGLLKKRVASLVTCRGRRRIGKSTLIEVFANRTKCRFLKIEGRKPEKGMTNEDELAAFAKQLSDQTSAETTPPSNWPDAFRRLDSQIRDRERTVVLLDEISWMAYFDNAFASDLKIAWDNLFKKHDKLVMVVCGSVSSWIRDNIIDNGAFLGRRSLDIVVKELPLAECAKFWGPAASRIDEREIIDVLSVTGGVPRYLEEIDPALSASENIRRLCFLPNSILRTDFDEMFRDVITHELDFSASVLRHLADGAKSAAEITAEMKLGKGGRVTAALGRLKEAGLAAEDFSINPETGKPAREVRYRLCDNYSRFFIKYVEPMKNTIDNGMFEFVSLDALDGIETIFGLAFENLVVNNCRALIPMLNLTGTLVTSAAPYRRSASESPRGRKGCQIDLLVQTRHTICVVEIKRRREIGREVINEVDAKVRAIARPDGVSARAAIVYSGHLSPTVAAAGYFDAIVPFGKLLGIQR